MSEELDEAEELANKLSDEDLEELHSHVLAIILARETDKEKLEEFE